jgi:hypothetical protein
MSDDDVASLNERPAPYRRDLRGDDLVYELILLMERLKPGDTLRIHRKALWSAGGSLDDVIPPPYRHDRWTDSKSGDLCIKRLK